MERKFTPKQVARALGVGESSVKRWVDCGKVEAVKTAGGHRKLALSAVVRLAREQGYRIIRPEVLGLAAKSAKCELKDVHEPLLEALTAGDEGASQAIIEPLYHAGHSIVELADFVIAPVFHELGHRWERGELSVHQERRACEIAVATLHNLRRMLPLAIAGAPKALITTPSGDHSELPARLVELVLREKGWDAKILGIALPLEEIRDAVEHHAPQLSLLSLTHIDHPERFIEQANEKLLDPTAEITRWIVGGQAIPVELQPNLSCTRYSTSMTDLACTAAKLQAELKQA
ncbi:MerR family transcriptional regulator [Aeoliella mucimassa]|nr:B12-binding domain-containing protein [Aeoliella mucimassa]